MLAQPADVKSSTPNKNFNSNRNMQLPELDVQHPHLTTVHHRSCVPEEGQILFSRCNSPTPCCNRPQTRLVTFRDELNKQCILNDSVNIMWQTATALLLLSGTLCHNIVTSDRHH